MWQIILDRYAVDPWWVGGSAAIFVIVLVLFVFSMTRNLRTLSWYYLAAILSGAVFAFYLHWLPVILELLVSYRADWSLIFLLNNPSLINILTVLIFFIVLYSSLAIMLLSILGLWSLFTFKWQRLRIVMERSFTDTWFVIFFAVISLILVLVSGMIFAQYETRFLLNLIEVLGFIFFLQLFLRFVDSAYLKTANIFLEYTYATGLVILLWHYVYDYLPYLSKSKLFSFRAETSVFVYQADFLNRQFFFDHVFSFFLVILILGFVSTFLLRALFASKVFLEHYHQKISLLMRWAVRVVLAKKERSYTGQRVIIGILLSVLVAFVLLVLAYKELYLVLVPVIFLAYFALFYLLDHQHDMMVKGELMEKR